MNLTLIIGIILILAGIWIFFTSIDLQTSDDLTKVGIMGYFGTALYRIFTKPKYQDLGKLEKKLYGILFVLVGIVCVYASKFL